ncbi:hypothetical protein BDN71DRAFT_1545783, partial [Pleurotus eryngii]
MVDFHSLSDEEINDLLEAEVKAAIDDILYDPSIDILSEQDRDNIRAFKLRMMSNMPCAVFNQMWQAFQHKITLDSEWVVMCRIAILTGIQPEWHDCCINSCIAYTSKYIYHISCPYCGEACRSPTGAVCRSFAYLPIMPQLRGYFMSSKMIDKLQYRSNYRQQDNIVADVFDSENYKRLQNHRVVIDGVKYHHRYFSDPDDIALGVCTDSYLLFKS